MQLTRETRSKRGHVGERENQAADNGKREIQALCMLSWAEVRDVRAGLGRQR